MLSGTNSLRKIFLICNEREEGARGGSVVEALPYCEGSVPDDVIGIFN
jgi:hypothetical protein